MEGSSEAKTVDPSLPSEADVNALLKDINRNWVTLKQFAKLSGRSYQIILRWKKLGHFRTVQVGGQFRVYQEELVRFFTQGNLPPEG